MFPLGKGGHVNICGAAQELILFSQRIMPLAEIFLFHKKMYTFVTLLFIRSVENQWKISANSVQNFVKSVYLENPSKVSIFQQKPAYLGCPHISRLHISKLRILRLQILRLRILRPCCSLYLIFITLLHSRGRNRLVESDKSYMTLDAKCW